MLRRRRSLRGKGREPVRTSWTRNFQGDWDISPDGTQVVIPNHSCGFARLRVQCLTRELGQPQERESTLPGLGDLKRVWAADGSGWFVLSETDIGERIFFVLPHARYYLLGHIQGWVVPSPVGHRVMFCNRPRRATCACSPGGAEIAK